jgi:hypothetical protein
MPDQLNKADRYRKDAADFSDLAKHTSSDFVRAYYQRIAQRYLSLAEGDLQAGDPPLALTTRRSSGAK